MFTNVIKTFFFQKIIFILSKKKDKNLMKNFIVLFQIVFSLVDLGSPFLSKNQIKFSLLLKKFD